MTRVDELISLLREAGEDGLTRNELADEMVLPYDQTQVYVSLARKWLRRQGASETIPYLDLSGGDRYRLVANYDPRAQAPVSQQVRQITTRQIELGAQYQRLGSRLMLMGKIDEARVAFGYAGQASFYQTQLADLDAEFVKLSESLAA